MSLTTISPIPFKLFAIAAVFGGTVAVLILAFGRISGAHINPTVTLAKSLSGKLNRNLLLPYLTFQLAGALAAGLALRFVFPPNLSSQYLGSTTLANNIDPWSGLALEAVGTLIMVYAVLHVSSKNLPLNHQASIIGCTLFVLILILGPLTGAGLNPARSIGPAVSSTHFENLWLYVVGPLAGAIVAPFAYKKGSGR